MRSPLLPYPSPDAARTAADAGPKGRRGGLRANPWVLELDGSWSFALAENPAAVPPRFADAEFGEEGWGRLEVPGTWTLQGCDRPHYTNVVMPFGNVPPSAPAAANPTGLYRARFDLPPAWDGRRVVLHVGGAESYLEAWCNGEWLGFSKDTRLPTEFDLTPCLASGSNLLAFMVVRYSDSSFIEDQDQWWFGGIYRGVYLYSTDFAYLADLDARPILSADLGSGRVEAAVKLGFTYDPAGPAGPGAAGPAEPAPPVRMAAPADYADGGLPEGLDPAAYQGDWRVRLALYDAGGEAALASAEEVVGARYRASRWDARFSLPVGGVRPWSHEDPYLYTLVVSLVSPSGREVEHAACRLGFRRVEVRGRALLVNGKRVLVKGVNRHEHDERKGKTLDLDGMVRDIELLKRNNFNAVRLSHYPNDERWYDLCDEYGLYLVDEANIECHAYYDQLCRDPRWAQAFLERGMRMVLRDKNHPCVIIWSLGNESGYGPNHDALAGWIRSFDPTRPLHYEGACRPEWGQGAHTLESVKRGKAATDIVSTMYPPISFLEAWAETTEDERPFIMCEFAHAMGNSAGGLSDYWALVESRKGLQGGFVWDWVDQGVEAFDPAGVKYWKYGGDFGDSPSDLDFVCNGLVFPDRSVKPALAECAKLFQPIKARAEHPLTGRIVVENRHDFSSLEGIELRWAIQVEGESLLSGRRGLPPIEAGASAELELEIPWTPELRAAVAEAESFLFLEFVLSGPRAWAPAGHRLAWEQLPLSPARPGARRASLVAFPWRSAARDAAYWRSAARVELAPESGGFRALSRADEGRAPYEALVSASGFLSSLVGRASELLASPLVMSLWRAPTENDGLKLFMSLRGLPDYAFYCEGKAMYAWLEAGLDEPRLDLVDMRLASGGAGLSIVHEAWGRGGRALGRFVQDWLFGQEGPSCTLLFDLDPGLPELPKVGLACSLAPGLDNARWYGRGPQECYADRKAGAAFGLYESSVDGLQVPYILPQENGNRTDVRWVELSGAGRGLRISSPGSFDFTASHHSSAQLWEARHTCDLVRMPETYLCIDVAQRGVGTATCGPDTLERYRLRPGPYLLDLDLHPIG
jgi:beta-galactosidase